VRMRTSPSRLKAKRAIDSCLEALPSARTSKRADVVCCEGADSTFKNSGSGKPGSGKDTALPEAQILPRLAGRRGSWRLSDFLDDGRVRDIKRRKFGVPLALILKQSAAKSRPVNCKLVEFVAIGKSRIQLPAHTCCE
jgi:hypothetical protein